MKNVTPFPSALHSLPLDVVLRGCPPHTQFDTVPIIRLYAENDPHKAEDIVCGLLEDIAQLLDAIQRSLAAHHFVALQKPVQSIALKARQFGLKEMAVTADHVLTCLKQNDSMALDATIARLERGFDVAVSEIWNFRDI